MQCMEFYVKESHSSIQMHLREGRTNNRRTHVNIVVMMMIMHSTGITKIIFFVTVNCAGKTLILKMKPKRDTDGICMSHKKGCKAQLLETN